jgi:hypothetical protein
MEFVLCLLYINIYILVYHTIYRPPRWSSVSYRSGGPGSIPGTTRKKLVGLEQGPLSLVTTTEELLDRKVAAPV